MNEYIILHCIHNKDSRNFVEKYGNRPDVIVLIDDGNEVRKKFPYISAFPTVIIPTPEYKKTDSAGNIITISSDIEYIRSPVNWEEVEDRINFWKNI
jgi:hypothetical protein